MPRNDELPPDTVPEYDNSDEVVCAVCSHEDCPHSHLPKPRLSKKEAQAYLGCKESTLLTRHSRGQMPKSITDFPLEFDAHCLAVLKYDHFVLGPHYDHEKHLAAVPGALAERARKHADRRKKLSDAMKKRLLARRTALNKPTPKKK
jgi:hypothetical protein